MPHLPPIQSYTPGAARRTAHRQRETHLYITLQRTRHQTPQEPPGAAHDQQTGNGPAPAGTPPQGHARPHSAARLHSISPDAIHRRAHPSDRQQHPDQRRRHWTPPTPPGPPTAGPRTPRRPDAGKDSGNAYSATRDAHRRTAGPVYCTEKHAFSHAEQQTRQRVKNV